MIAPLPPTPASETSVVAAVDVLQPYYAAIRRHDYRAAYAVWHGHRSYAAFCRGYAGTATARLTPLPPFVAEGGAGQVYAEIRVQVDAITSHGRRQRFRGSYTLHRVNDVDGATRAQQQWHIMSAKLVPVSD